MTRIVFRCLLLGLVCAVATPAIAQDKDTKKEKAPAKKSGEQEEQSAADLIRNATDHLRKKQKYLLQYRIKEGEKVRWSVEHTAITKTKIANKEEETASRSNAVKVWTVSRVDSVGNITFVHSIESVKMWHKIGEQDPVSYDSIADKEVPEDYQNVQERIGRPLATITINPHGQVMDRKSNVKHARFGAGDITVPLPKNEIVIGHKWYVPKTLNATDENGRRLQLNSRIHYSLANVKGHNAFISFRTEVLTPVESEKVRSQIMQQLTKGYLVFDMNKGVPVRKEVEWDDKVHGYEGPDSYLSYSGKLSEKLATSAPLQPVKNKVSSLESDEKKETKRK